MQHLQPVVHRLFLEDIKSTGAAAGADTNVDLTLRGLYRVCVRVPLKLGL